MCCFGSIQDGCLYIYMCLLYFLVFPVVNDIHIRFCVFWFLLLQDKPKRYTLCVIYVEVDLKIFSRFLYHMRTICRYIFSHIIVGYIHRLKNIIWSRSYKTHLGWEIEKNIIFTIQYFTYICIYMVNVYVCRNRQTVRIFHSLWFITCRQNSVILNCLLGWILFCWRNSKEIHLFLGCATITVPAT